MTAMFAKNPKLFIMLLLAALSACNLPNNTATEQSSSEAEQTAAAATVAALLTDAPTNAAPPGTTSTSGGPPTAVLEDAAAFVSDVTVPDGTVFEPGETFTKTWRLRNDGDSTWTTSYSVVFDEGNDMGADASIPLTNEVAPGQTVDISVEMTAPDDVGEHSGFWLIRNAAGQIFGVGEDSDQPFFVVIVVAAEGQVPATKTPIAGGATIASASLSGQPANYSGACPVDIDFSGTISTSSSGTFVYSLEAGSNTPGFQFTALPASQTGNNTSGSNESFGVNYFLTIASDVNGWARLSVTGSNGVTSNLVNFTINCN
jgi:hypothetical protein